MGPVMNRVREHLGPSDVAIIVARRTLLAAARALREHGATPPGLERVASRLALDSQFLPKRLTWEQVAQQALGAIAAPVAA